MSLVFQNIDPHPPLRPASVYPRLFFWGGGGRTHALGGEGGGGSIFWKTRDIGLPSYSNNLSTSPSLICLERQPQRRKARELTLIGVSLAYQGRGAVGSCFARTVTEA